MWPGSLFCCVMSYPVLILSATVGIPQRRRRRPHRHRHPRRTAAAAAAAAAVRRLLCCGCGWCLLRLFLKHFTKNCLFCCGDRGDRARPSRADVPQLIWRGHRHRHLRPCPRRCCYYCGSGCCDVTAQQLLLLRCCLSDGVVLGLPLSVSLYNRATAPRLNSKFDAASPLPACDMEAVFAVSAIRSPQTHQKHAGVNLAFF